MTPELGASTSKRRPPDPTPTVGVAIKPQRAAPRALEIAQRVGLFGAPTLLMGVAALVGLLFVRQSGSLWADAPRYANGAAMIHDWLASGRLLAPVAFAKEYYCQYPGFSIPYHPPGYPGLMAAFFFVTGGVSYISARAFVALCLGVLGVAFWALLRRFDVSRTVALGCALLLITTPEIALWSRDTMSEIPALAVAMYATYVFARWLDTERPADCWKAFAFAELAFFCRVTTAGLLPSWFVFAFLTRRFRPFRSRHLYAASATYLVLNALWVSRVVVPYAKYETVDNAAQTRVPRLSWANLSFHPAHIPAMVGWVTVFAAVAGLAFAVVRAKNWRLSTPVVFSLAWLVCFYLFQLVAAANEQRYFTFAIPGIVGLLVPLFDSAASRPRGRFIAAGVFVVVLLSNVALDGRMARGVVGYEAVAKRLAATDGTGNVLFATPYLSDLIFRYRAEDPAVSRRVFRGDRSLEIAVSEYAGVPEKVIARSPDDVLNVLQRGRIRYLVTYEPVTPGQPLTYDVNLARTAVEAEAGDFRRVSDSPLYMRISDSPQYMGNVYGRVSIWEYLKPLPPGPAELTTVIPTASLNLQCLERGHHTD